MTSGDIFSIKSTKFQHNITEEIKALRGENDFTDITLVAGDGQTVEAHKVILIASSPILKNILAKNRNPHPLCFMRGIKTEVLAAILDFMYHGEAFIASGFVNEFLTFAEELKLNGISETLSEAENKDHQSDSSPPLMESVQTSEDCESLLANIFEDDTKELHDILDGQNVLEQNFSSYKAGTFPGLDEMINAKIERKGSYKWCCSVCDKMFQDRRDVARHIEGKHLDAVKIPCQLCGKSFGSRNSLRKHLSSTFHKSKK